MVVERFPGLGELKGELQRTGEESPILFYPNIQLGPIRSVDRKQNLLMSLELADPILIFCDINY